MLLIQDICFSWSKEERNAVYAKIRAEFPMVYSLDNFPNTFRGDVLVQRLNFRQKEIAFQISYMNDLCRYQSYFSTQDLNLTNLSIYLAKGRYEVTFFYDERRSGQPTRQGHNKDYHNINSPLYCHNILNETAFSLGLGQYGRVIWNERKIDYDTGEWYYQLHVLNLLHSLNKMPETNTFLIHKPDFEYKQMAVLY